MVFSNLQAEVDSFDYWYHRIELPGGVVTPGWAPWNTDVYGIPERLDGKRVLDVGAWDGYWTFEALRRGATEVLAIDDFSDHLESNVTRTAWDTFDLCRIALGHSDETCKRQELTVYDLSRDQHGLFDVVFFFGTLYHLRYPLLGLDKLATVCGDEIFVETAILDDFSPYNGGLNKGYPGQQMVMEFYPGDQYGDNDSNWWVPTLNCLAKMVAAAGFQIIEAWKLDDKPSQVKYCRGFVHGKKN